MYESGKASCYEVIDKTNSRFQYFNAKHKRILPESPLTPDPVIYDCNVVALPQCDDTPSTGTKCQVNKADVTFCKYNNQIYKTVDSDCVVADPVPEKLCVKNENTLPPCEVNGGNGDAICLEHGYCIHSNTKIYSKDKDSSTCTEFDVKIDNDLLYFDKTFEMIESIDKDKVIYTSYKCQSDDTCVINPEKAIGQLVRKPNSVEMCLAGKKSISLTQSEQVYYNIAPTSNNFAGKTSFIIKTTGKSIVKVATYFGYLPNCKVISTIDESDVCKNNSNDEPANYCKISEDIYETKGTACAKITTLPNCEQTEIPDALDVCKDESGGGSLSYCMIENDIYETDELNSRCNIFQSSIANCFLTEGHSWPDDDEDACKNAIDQSKVDYCKFYNAIYKTVDDSKCGRFIYPFKTCKKTREVDTNSVCRNESDSLEVQYCKIGNIIFKTNGGKCNIIINDLTDSEELPICKQTEVVDANDDCKNSIDNTEVNYCKRGEIIYKKGLTPSCNKVNDFSTLPTCFKAAACNTDGSEATAVNYCINSNYIYKKGDTCVKLTSNTANSVSVTMFKKASSGIEISNNGTEAKYAYRCFYDENKESKICLIVKGYVVSGNNVIGCSGYTGDDCVVTPLTTCNATEDGKIGKEGSNKVVCVGGKSLVKVPTSATEKPIYVAYKSTTRNGIYEVEKDTYTLIEVGPNYAMKIKDYPGK